MMDVQLAQTILWVGIGVGAAVWVAGLSFLLSAARTGDGSVAADEAAAPPVEDDAIGPAGSSRRIGGGAEVEGTPEDLSGRLTASLAQPTKVGMLIRIL